MGSESHLQCPGSKPETSWRLVRFITCCATLGSDLRPLRPFQDSQPWTGGGRDPVWQFCSAAGVLCWGGAGQGTLCSWRKGSRKAAGVPGELWWPGLCAPPASAALLAVGERAPGRQVWPPISQGLSLQVGALTHRRKWPQESEPRGVWRCWEEATAGTGGSHRWDSRNLSSFPSPPAASPPHYDLHVGGF